MPRVLLLTAVLAVSLAGCERRLSLSERTRAEQVVRARLEAWVLTVNSREVDSLGAFYHRGPELTVAWSDGRRTRGWEEETARQREFLSGVSQITLAIRDVMVDVLAQDVALATYGLSLDLTSPQGREVSAGPGTIVWVRDPADNVWRIRTLHTGRREVPQTPRFGRDSSRETRDG